jgi:hypothetical protein
VPEIIGFVARLPFDVAAHAGNLSGRNWLAGEERIDGGAEVFSGDWFAIAWAAVIELAAID